jgi:hypothetical protein
MIAEAEIPADHGRIQTIRLIGDESSETCRPPSLQARRSAGESIPSAMRKMWVIEMP